MRILDPEELARCDARAVRAIAARRDCTIAVASGELSGHALAAALHADWLAATSDAVLDFGPSTAAEQMPGVWSGAIWRIGPAALRLFLLAGGRIAVDKALDAGLVDAVVPPGRLPLEWAREWLAGRSAAALDSAAALIRRRGGDVLERAEFARLFATGEPQEGLNAFLGKRKPQFGPRAASSQPPDRPEPEKR